MRVDEVGTQGVQLLDDVRHHVGGDHEGLGLGVEQQRNQFRRVGIDDVDFEQFQQFLAKIRAQFALDVESALRGLGSIELVYKSIE